MKNDWTKMLVCGLLALSLSAQSQDAPKTDATPPEAPKEETTTPPPPPAKDEITQGEFALRLAFQLGLFPVTSVAPSQQEAAAALSLNGISPFEGWKLDLVLERGDFARMIIQAMGRAAEIPPAEANNKQAWLDLAIKLGLDMGVEEAIEQVTPSINPIAGGTRNPLGASSNPQDRAGVLGEPGEDLIGGAISARTVGKVLPLVKPLPPPPPPSPKG